MFNEYTLAVARFSREEGIVVDCMQGCQSQELVMQQQFKLTSFKVCNFGLIEKSDRGSGMKIISLQR